jgi:ATP-dependent RNA helicase RhlE
LPDLKKIIARLPAQRQTLLFSATMSPEIARLGLAILRQPERITITPQATLNQSVTQTAYPVPVHRKSALLLHLLESWETPSVLVFTRTKHGAKRLARTIYDAGHGVAELHSNRSPSQRATAMNVFRNKTVPIMVATNIAARGLDVRHITHVVNFDVPNAPEEYVHRIGRTGRGGDAGDAVVLVAPEDNGLLARIERQLGQRILRKHVDDFDYQAGKAVVSPTNHKPGKKFKEFARSKKKPYRGQGRR